MYISVGTFEYICIGMNPFADAFKFVTVTVSIKLNEMRIGYRIH